MAEVWVGLHFMCSCCCCCVAEVRVARKDSGGSLPDEQVRCDGWARGQIPKQQQQCRNSSTTILVRLAYEQ